jgi:hypothetical protein
MKAGYESAFFSLEYTEKDMRDRFAALGVDRSGFAGLFSFDCSGSISADYIATRLASTQQGMLVVIDYLQILDQKRENPDLMSQVRRLRELARERGLIMVFVSQIDRAYDPAAEPFPDIRHVRLPNPLDLGLFDKTCFLSNGAVRFGAAA